MIEQALYTLLAADAAVGAIAADRISPHQRLQGTELPAITYTFEELEAFRHLGGSSNLKAAQVQCTSIADTYAVARELSEAVIAEMSSASGAVGSTGITIIASRFLNEQPVDTGIGEGEEDLPFQVQSTFTIHYTEA